METNPRDLFTLSFNIVAQVFFDSPHGHHGVVAQGLDNLEWGHESLLVNSFQHSVELISCLLEDLWAGSEIGQGIHV